jgi:double-stranded uracil-DNA glycosylase
MPLLQGLPVLSGDFPRLLIVGSFPSTLSLDAGEYYANPRNQFWRIIENHLKIPEAAPYPERISALKERHVALWDVIHSCERDGAMDNTIRNVTLNNIPLFIQDHPTIRIVLANGVTAGRYLKKIGDFASPCISIRILPSTSPANARTSFRDKLRAWETLSDVVNGSNDQ